MFEWIWAHIDYFMRDIFAAAWFIHCFIINPLILLIVAWLKNREFSGIFCPKNVFLCNLCSLAVYEIGISLSLIKSVVYSKIDREKTLNPNLFTTIYRTSDGTVIPEWLLDEKTYAWVSVAFGAIVFFVFTLFVVFRKSELSILQRIFASFAFSVFAAPYALLIPSSMTMIR